MARVDIGEAIRAGATLRGSGSCSRTATAPDASSIRARKASVGLAALVASSVTGVRRNAGIDTRDCGATRNGAFWRLELIGICQINRYTGTSGSCRCRGRW